MTQIRFLNLIFVIFYLLLIWLYCAGHLAEKSKRAIFRSFLAARFKLENRFEALGSGYFFRAFAPDRIRSLNQNYFDDAVENDYKPKLIVVFSNNYVPNRLFQRKFYLRAWIKFMHLDLAIAAAIDGHDVNRTILRPEKHVLAVDIHTRTKICVQSGFCFIFSIKANFAVFQGKNLHILVLIVHLGKT